MKAFSLIELMVVIAIVAVLSVAALPVYKDYIIKTKVVKAIDIASTYQQKFLTAFDNTGSMRQSTNPAGSSDYGLAFPSACISNLVYSWGASWKNTAYVFMEMDATCLGLPASETANNDLILMWAHNSGTNTFTTHCGQWNATGYLNLRYLPASCQGTLLNTIESALN